MNRDVDVGITETSGICDGLVYFNVFVPISCKGNVSGIQPETLFCSVSTRHQTSQCRLWCFCYGNDRRSSGIKYPPDDGVRRKLQGGNSTSFQCWADPLILSFSFIRAPRCRLRCSPDYLGWCQESGRFRSPKCFMEPCLTDRCGNARGQPESDMIYRQSGGERFGSAENLRGWE